MMFLEMEFHYFDLVNYKKLDLKYLISAFGGEAFSIKSVIWDVQKPMTGGKWGVLLIATHSTAEPLFFLLAWSLSICRQLLIMVWLPVGLLIAAVSQQLLINLASTLTLRTNWIRSPRRRMRTTNTHTHTHTIIDIGSAANGTLIWFSFGTVIMQLVGTIVRGGGEG